jgi:hypothetical protein
VTSDPKFAHKSNFLHPVIYYYSKIPSIPPNLSFNEQKKAILDSSSKKLHLIEDILTLWTHPLKHQLQYRRFIESITNKDLKVYKKQTCLDFHAFNGFYPEMCKIYWEKPFK